MRTHQESYAQLEDGRSARPTSDISDIAQLKSLAIFTTVEEVSAEHGGVLGSRNEDGGKRAWLFMISACLIEAVLWGFTTSYGIFLSHYEREANFRSSHILATVGTCASGIPFLGAPVVTLAVSRWPQYQRQMVWTGTSICILSLIGASLASRDWHLLLSQGIGYGVGVALLYYPMLAMVNTWFIARRGLAYGVLFAAAGLTGTTLPFMISELLERFGYGWTLRGYALAAVILVAPSLPFCHGRPQSTSKGIPSEPVCGASSNRPDWSIFRNPSLAIFSMANFFQGLAYYIPSLWLPSYATALNLSSTQVVLVIALLNGSQVIAQVLLGFISDTISVHFLIPISTIGATVLTISLWYFGSSAATALSYSLLFGLFTGGFTALWARFNMTISKDSATQEFAYGLLAMQRGLGSVAAGPISATILRVGTHGAQKDDVGRFRHLALFVAICMGVASMGGGGALICKRTKLEENEEANVQRDSV